MRSKQKSAAAVAARKQEADELAAQATLAEIAARREADRRVEQRKEAVDAARAKKDAKLRRKAAKVEEAVMDWPARFWNWCRNNLYHYGYFKSIYSKNAAVRPLRSTFESLGLKEDDVARLHEQFVIIDKDGSGAIELWELLDYLDLQRNRFAKRVFAIFDADGSNQIDFKEFVVALWQSVRGVRGTASRRWRRPAGGRRHSKLAQVLYLKPAELVMFAFDLCESRLRAGHRLRRVQRHAQGTLRQALLEERRRSIY